MLYVRLVLPAAVMLIFTIVIWCPVAAPASPKADERARKFAKAHEAKVCPLEAAAALAWWNASVSGKDEDFQEKERTQNRIDEALANPRRSVS
jgi:peptidyl-dipeptidase A